MEGQNLDALHNTSQAGCEPCDVGDITKIVRQPRDENEAYPHWPVPRRQAACKIQYRNDVISRKLPMAVWVPALYIKKH